MKTEKRRQLPIPVVSVSRVVAAIAGARVNGGDSSQTLTATCTGRKERSMDRERGSQHDGAGEEAGPVAVEVTGLPQP